MHPTHMIVDGECVRCAMRVHWPGITRRCPPSCAIQDDARKVLFDRGLYDAARTLGADHASARRAAMTVEQRREEWRRHQRNKRARDRRMRSLRAA